ncbi:hypothetical protein [Anaeromyxobacter oryzisoli]|uniref:hypothetical protein n=1 Tax=Anaeromyxobacter oryzisoli TaxID=2925408 RepID=UPI001F5A3155|nr:hypothetical protein [Anaeromyxobacter sp. SG63]
MSWLSFLGLGLAIYLLRAVMRPPHLIELPTLDDRLEPMTILPRGAVPPEVVRLGGAARTREASR